MGGKRDKIFWGAYDIDLEDEIKKVKNNLEKIVPNPTKLEASKLIAYRSKNGINFMTESEIKKFIMRIRGYE
ncbi:MAG: hypothetical protein ACFFG0_07990 [Candidatus Thorarchaeota archaeon]